MISIANPLSRHIGNIKRRLLIIGATILVAFIIMFSVSADLIEWFKRPFADDLIFYGPATLAGNPMQCALRAQFDVVRVLMS